MIKTKRIDRFTGRIIINPNLTQSVTKGPQRPTQGRIWGRANAPPPPIWWWGKGKMVVGLATTILHWWTKCPPLCPSHGNFCIRFKNDFPSLMLPEFHHFMVINYLSSTWFFRFFWSLIAISHKNSRWASEPPPPSVQIRCNRARCR